METHLRHGRGGDHARGFRADHLGVHHGGRGAPTLHAEGTMGTGRPRRGDGNQSRHAPPQSGGLDQQRLTRRGEGG